METGIQISRSNNIVGRLNNLEIFKNVALLIGFLGIISFLVIASSCSKDDDGIVGQGATVTRDISLPDFNEIELNISADVYLTQGNEQSIRIDAEQNIIDNIIIKVVRDKWNIDFFERVWRHDDIRIYIAIPEITDLEINSSGDIHGRGTINTNNLKLDINGSGDVELDVDANSVYNNVDRSGDIKLSGTTHNLNIKINGSGDVKAFSLMAYACVIDVNGSGDSKVYVNNVLKVSINGSGDVYYKGHPQITTHDNGSGSVHNSN